MTGNTKRADGLDFADYERVRKAEDVDEVTQRTRFSFCAHTCSAKLYRRRRSDRAGTRQRLGAPLLGSGKHQTPPNRYQPARLLTPLSGAIRGGSDPTADVAGRPPARNRSRDALPAHSSTEHRTQIVYGSRSLLSTNRTRELEASDKHREWERECRGGKR